jgi:hypothetical protein
MFIHVFKNLRTDKEGVCMVVVGYIVIHYCLTFILFSTACLERYDEKQSNDESINLVCPILNVGVT